ncbi:hypothetical protein ACSS6W_009663 [Trichoderma asperelloides]
MEGREENTLYVIEAGQRDNTLLYLSEWFFNIQHGLTVSMTKTQRRAINRFMVMPAISTRVVAPEQY